MKVVVVSERWIEQLPELWCNGLGPWTASGSDHPVITEGWVTLIRPAEIPLPRPGWVAQGVFPDPERVESPGGGPTPVSDADPWLSSGGNGDRDRPGWPSMLGSLCPGPGCWRTKLPLGEAEASALLQLRRSPWLEAAALMRL